MGLPGQPLHYGYNGQPNMVDMEEDECVIHRLPVQVVQSASPLPPGMAEKLGMATIQEHPPPPPAM